MLIVTVMHRQSPAVDLIDGPGEPPKLFLNCLFWDCESGFDGKATPDQVSWCNSFGHPDPMAVRIRHELDLDIMAEIESNVGLIYPPG